MTPTAFYPLKPPVRRKRKGGADAVTPPAALVLVAAGYDDGTAVELTFDRAIDIAGLDAGAISVADGPMMGELYAGTGSGTLISPNTVRVSLVAQGSSAAPGIFLTVGANSGIVAVNDGGTWAGVTELELPFP